MRRSVRRLSVLATAGVLALAACAEREPPAPPPPPPPVVQPDPAPWLPMTRPDTMARECLAQAEDQVRRRGFVPISVRLWTFSEAYLAKYRGHPPTRFIEIDGASDVGDRAFEFHCIQWSDSHRTLHLIRQQ